MSGDDLGTLSRAELLLDRRVVEPDPLALELSVGCELEHVEQPDAHGTALAVAKAPVAVDDLTRPQRLVGGEGACSDSRQRRGLGRDAQRGSRSRRVAGVGVSQENIAGFIQGPKRVSDRVGSTPSKEN